MEKLGVIAPQAELVIRADKRVSRGLLAEAIPLFKTGEGNIEIDYLNPGVLEGIIKESPLSRQDRASLRQITLALEPFRRLREDEWWRIRSLPNLKPEHGYLSKLLARQLLANFGIPSAGYVDASQVLGSLYSLPSDNFLRSIMQFPVELNNSQSRDNLRKPVRYPRLEHIPTDFTVPRIKTLDDGGNSYEKAIFALDRGKSKLLKGQRFVMVVGGSPHSGKSTTAASLVSSAKDLIYHCASDGIFNPNDIEVCVVDLDLVSPTIESIVRPQPVIRNPNLRWNDQLIARGVTDLNKARVFNNLVVADMPGGSPDNVTQSFARGVDFSILIEKGRDEEAHSWRDFLLSPHLPTYLVYAHTRLNELGRYSGIREYESRTRGDRYDFLRGRIVNLNRQVVRGDPFIDFAAAVLLFDYLPTAVLRRDAYRGNLQYCALN